jgi:hypothetical protein
MSWPDVTNATDATDAHPDRHNQVLGPEWNHDTGGTTTTILNIRAAGTTNAKALVRIMPAGTPSGDKAEFTLMGTDIDLANRWWADFKVSEDTSTLRRLHILSDREGTEEPITRVAVEIDGEAESTVLEEFSIIRNGWIGNTESGSGAGVFMLRIIGGTGITRIENGTIQLSTGDLKLGSDAGDVVVKSTGAFRAFGDGTDKLGASGFRFSEGWFKTFLDFTETTDPTAPAANGARVYTKDNGSGKTQLCVRFTSGAVQVLSTEP